MRLSKTEFPRATFSICATTSATASNVTYNCPAGPIHTFLHGRQQGRDVSGAQREIAANYKPGDVVFYRSGSMIAGIPRGSYAELLAVDIENNRVTVRQNEEEITYNPRRLKGVEIYTREQRSFAAGDRIQTTRAIHSRGIANGDFGTIESIDQQNGIAVISFDDEPPKALKVKDAHYELGYATTNPKAQGATLQSGYLSIDGKHASQENLYVPATRFAEDFHIAVTDKPRLYYNANRSHHKSHAIDSILETREKAILPELGVEKTSFETENRHEGTVHEIQR